MKILLDNYNDLYSTEASALHQCLVRVGVDAHIWENKNISAFDAFDQIDPDVFITSYMMLTEDVLKRLSGTKISVVIKVEGITENGAADLENLLTTSKINCPFVFYSFKKPSGFNKLKAVQIMPAADIFIPTIEGGRKIPCAIISDGDFKTPEYTEVYHKVGMATEAVNDADVTMNIIDLNRCASMYENVELCGSNQNLMCGQLFFDMTLKVSGKCILDVTDENREMIVTFMEDLFPELSEKPDEAKRYVLSTVLSKHTCLNRAERMMQNLKLEEVCLNLRKLQESLRNNLQNPRS
jgi:hypothetical protein